MEPQFLRTESGEELVVLSRAYDSLLAGLGDEEAEDRMTVRIVDEVRARVDSSEEALATLEELGLRGAPRPSK